VIHIRGPAWVKVVRGAGGVISGGFGMSMPAPVAGNPDRSKMMNVANGNGHFSSGRTLDRNGASLAPRAKMTVAMETTPDGSESLTCGHGSRTGHE